MSEEKLPALRPITELDIKLPEKPEALTDKEGDKIQKSIIANSAVTTGAELVFNQVGIPALIGTDRAGSNEIVANLSPEDKIEDGKATYVKYSALNKEISVRIQEPRDSLQRAHLRYSEECLNAVRDNPQLDVNREQLKSRLEKDMPKAKAEVLNQAETCISNAPLKKTEVHHKNRVADKPREAADKDNLVAVNQDVHQKIHAEGANSKESLTALAKKEGWKPT